MEIFQKRIIKEVQRLLQEPVSGIRAVLDGNSVRHFHAFLAGPKDSPFEGGVFKLEIFLPEEYPMCAPQVRFLTKIYHPNIDTLGRVGLDILMDKWSPVFQIMSVLQRIQALLCAPNPYSPLVNDIVAPIWKEDVGEALRIAREWTRHYATGN